MVFKYLSMARQALKRRGGRSLLTVLGIVASIGSITLLINVGLGAQRQIVGDDTDDNLLTIRSGQAVKRDQKGDIIGYNPAQVSGTVPSLTDKDLALIETDERIAASSPVAVLGEEIEDLTGNKFSDGHAIAADSDLLQLIGYGLSHGSNTLNGSRPTAVVGDQVARELFGNSKPISHEVILGEQSFVIVGVLKAPKRLNPFNIGFNYRRAVLVPFQAVKELNAEQGAETPIYEILAQTTASIDRQLVEDINSSILVNHHQKQDFSIFRNNELVFLTASIFKIIRNLTIVVGLIFLAVGGIGLMNAMQASAAERRLEIGIRKAVGATSQQIFHQFLVEALLLSLIGGILGILTALMLGLFVSYWTPIRPVIQLDVIVLMLTLTQAVGLLFGSQAAIGAALQRPGDHLQ